MRIRYRIDGRLYKSLEVPLHLLRRSPAASRSWPGMDISERRLPQDGRVNVLLEGRKIDLRVSTFPTHRGEKTVIRVLDTRSVSLNLQDLGIRRRHAGRFAGEHPRAQRHRARDRTHRQRQSRPRSTPR
jgi:type IV pilus assembly protein PilB